MNDNGIDFIFVIYLFIDDLFIRIVITDTFLHVLQSNVSL